MNGLWVFGSLARRGGCSYKGRSQGNSEAGKESRLFLGHSAPFLVTWISPRTAEEMDRKKEKRKGREEKDHRAIRVGRRTKQQLFPEVLRAKINGLGLLVALSSPLLKFHTPT